MSDSGSAIGRDLADLAAMVDDVTPAIPKPRSTGAFVDLEKGGLRLVLRTTYIAEFIEELKQAVPLPAREWDPKVKLWAVQRDYWHQIKPLLTKYFEDRITYGAGADAALTELLIDQAQEGDPDFAAYFTLGIRSEAPICVLHAAYRAIRDDHSRIEAIYANAAATGYDAGAALSMDIDLPALDMVKAAYKRCCRHRNIPPIKYKSPYLPDATSVQQTMSTPWTTTAPEEDDHDG